MAILYGISDSLLFLGKFLESGCQIVQYRPLSWALDDRSTPDFSFDRVLINDSLSFATQVGARGVHLGQQDLDRYNKDELVAYSGMLGISTHSPQEIERAMQYKPDYIAFGPIFNTNTKKVPFEPQGVSCLEKVVRSVGVPVVAIGGITRANSLSVAETGVAAIASIGEIQRLSSEEILSWTNELANYKSHLDLL
ncbi:MAG: thiamine phosphate synthase [Bdellovibrionales bacterium]|nr:thiamine phosphate synthase [Bdellovibrionales bacterium]